MRVANPPKAAQRFTYEISADRSRVVVQMVFPTQKAAEQMADWMEDVLCDAGIEAHESELHDDD